ncbi:MAG TPA: tetratricopeptide repeat protein [Vicinamibacterales bacterium]|jgi:tetratricopeptide (TPR) repeat protein|nr:tetratricopeptide repeat protein [Vicinamibacterales bacterium]
MTHRSLAAGLVLAFVTATSVGLSAIHSAGADPSKATSGSPEALATDAFNSGVKHLNAGDKAELKAASAKPADADKAMKQARDEYGKALNDFKKAVELSPKMHRAHNGLGYAYRKTGDYAKALESYNTALQISPDFYDAIEYRGEAYLGLNRTEDARQAYLKLFGSSREHADILMKAMKAWVERRHADPAGVDPAALASFEGWLHERAELADRTVNMARVTPHTSWR